jgi:hypothetical protein
MQRNSKLFYEFHIKVIWQYWHGNICMFADGAGISLSLHVPASSEGERQGLWEPRINYGHNEHLRSVEV